MLAINIGYITYFGKVQAIFRRWFIKKMLTYFNP